MTLNLSHFLVTSLTSAVPAAVQRHYVLGSMTDDVQK